MPLGDSSGTFQLEIGACIAMYTPTKLIPDEPTKLVLKAQGP